jgi:superfamily II DNA or RNA helicase
MKSYDTYISGKLSYQMGRGLDVKDIHTALFPWQAMLVKRALGAGRHCFFTDTGTGKTIMQCEWARHIPGRVLILAPLAVAEQTSDEARDKLGLNIRYLRKDDPDDRIVITNYEMLDRFDPAAFSGVVLDESSILKAYDGRTRQRIIDAFEATPYRLACTATPAPNDFLELGNHAEFLGVKTRSEMLSEYFVHDGSSTQSWRLKGHAIEEFWKWVCAWAVVMKTPSDFGYNHNGFSLPPCEIHQHIVKVDHTDAQKAGYLFAMEAVTLADQRATRRATVEKRAAVLSKLCGGSEPAIVWCELNAEADAAESAIPGAVQIKGSDSRQDKHDRLVAFANGEIRVLVTKPSIAGFGLNWQHCRQVIFVGPSHSFEQTYQAIRRCWRFGQTKPVHVHMIMAETDTAIVRNYKRKEREFEELQCNMVKYASQALLGSRWIEYLPETPMKIPAWCL